MKMLCEMRRIGGQLESEPLGDTRRRLIVIAENLDPTADRWVAFIDEPEPCPDT